jgi:xylulose-5-phosphate/fructose-6-phosphate phosphoketolase
VRVINVVEMMWLQPDSEHPHGLSDHEFDALFTTDKPVTSPTTAIRCSSTG